MVYLRTVPTKYKGFCARLGPCRKSRTLQEFHKEKWGKLRIFPRQLALNLNKNADVSIFLKKRRKDSSLRVFKSKRACLNVFDARYIFSCHLSSKSNISASRTCFARVLRHLQVHVYSWILAHNFFYKKQLVFQLEVVNS